MLKTEQRLSHWLIQSSLCLATFFFAIAIHAHIGTRDELLPHCESSALGRTSSALTKKRFAIEQRHHDRVKRINEAKDTKEDTGQTFARIDEEHGTVVLTPYIDPPLDAKFMVLALHGFGSSNSNASTMARIGEMMAGKSDGASQKRLFKHEGYFPVVFESIDQPTCGGGLDEHGEFREGGGPTAEDVPDLQSMIDWVVSYAESMMRRNPGLPLVIVTRSSSAMFGVAAARIFKDRGIPVPVFTTSATLPGTQPVDHERIAAGSDVLHRLAAEGEFALHRPSLEWVDRLMLQLDWTPETFKDLDVYLMVGREDQEVVAYERARYREIADANDTVHFEDLPHMKHNLFDLKRPYGLNTYYALYDFMNEMLKKQRDPQAYAQAKLEAKEQRRAAIEAVLSRYNVDSGHEEAALLTAREISSLGTVAISARNQVAIDQAKANLVLLHDLGTDVGHMGSLEDTIRRLQEIAPNIRVEAPNLPGSIDEASPNFAEYKSMDALVEWLELYLRQKKEEAPHLPLFVYTQGSSSILLAALNHALANFRMSGVDDAYAVAAERAGLTIDSDASVIQIPVDDSIVPAPRLIDGIIIDNGMAAGDKSFVKFDQKARGKILHAGTKAENVFRWFRARAKEVQWTPNYFGPELKFEAGRNRMTDWKHWARRYGFPTYVLIMSGGLNEFMVKEDVHTFSSFGNVDRPSVLRFDLVTGGRNSWFNDDNGRSTSILLDFISHLSTVTSDEPFKKREFQDAHTDKPAKK